MTPVDEMVARQSLERRKSNLRWWPAVVVVALWVAFLLVRWFAGPGTRQDKVIATMAASALGLMLLLLWFVLASRARWTHRLAVLGLAVVGALVASQFLTITGVSGDLVPILGWKDSNEVVVDQAVERSSTDVVVAVTDGSADYPQFLGPDRNATVAGVRLARDWQASPPREIWRRQVGEAWSGFAVAAGFAVTQEQHGTEEQVVAYELATGEPRWRHADETRYETTIGGIGPRATPTIVGGSVYTLGATGSLNALDLESGDLLWSQNVLENHGATAREWGMSGSPLVAGDLIIVSAGGENGNSLVAYRRDNGELAWTGGDGRSSYSSPMLATLSGREQVVIRNRYSINGHDPATGEVLWSQDWPGDQPGVAQPVLLSGDRLLISSGYGIGAKLFRIGDDGVETLWESLRMKAKFTNLVEHQGYIYGLDDGVMVCLDPATGERCWKKGRYGHGQVILAGDLLLVTAEEGDVVLIDPNSERLDELGKFSVFDRRTWNTPALAGRLLLVRNDREAALYELPVRQ